MRVFFCFLGLLVCVSSQLTAFGYHERVGVPRAQELFWGERVVGRIVGGSQAAQFAYPYQAGIIVTLTSGWTSVCGGSLISNTRVLTAAHCWWDGQYQGRTLTVVLGSVTLFTGGTRKDTSDVTAHTSWNPSSGIMFDIAMVKIASVNYDNSIQAIPLPTMAEVNNDFVGFTAVASGFGKTSDMQNNIPSTTSLFHVNLQVISNTVCQQSYDITIHGSHLCTSGLNGVGTCEGDSGGPLTAVLNNQRTLIGVVSFGLGDLCQASYPSVFTRVTAYLNWIQGNM